VATHECDADEEFKKAYITATKDDVTIIKSPVGLPGRAIKNAFLDAVSAGLKHPKKCVHKCLHSCAEENSPYCIAQALVNAYKGRLKHGFAFAGANAYLIDKIISVKELMNTLTVECETYIDAHKERFDRFVAEKKEGLDAFVDEKKEMLDQLLKREDSK